MSYNSNIRDDKYIVMLNRDASALTLDIHLLDVSFGVDTFNDNQTINSIDHIFRIEGAYGYAGRFEPRLVEQIRKDPGVAFVEVDTVMYAQNVERGAPWGLARVSRRNALEYSGTNRYFYDARGGENVTAYIIDTGINWKHEDFQGRASWGKTIPPYEEDEDGHGHGSHCGGTVAGFKYGVAKKAKVVGVKVLGSDGSGTTSDVIKGIEWAVKAAKKEAEEAKRTGRKHKGSVANMSLGGGYSRALNRVLNAAVQQGLHFAVAAGNEDQDACHTSPASAELAITVGATDIADYRAWFSNWGSCVDIFAPGVDITSTWNDGKNSTNTISGTSMASPHVAGVLAYILSMAEEPLTNKELRAKLIELATSGVLDDIPRSTPNRLAYTNPPKGFY
ncbi:proteinase B [Entomophthora muscae]|uniref:Proteinase B n=1 Tax=Entomophthora muscae TaxID=34485 RepID=A0ACC2USP7_9FUNG|nr:proteinase B [Entomophthora muscae]